MTVAATTVTLNINYEGRLLTVLLTITEKKLRLGNMPKFKTTMLKPYSGEIDTQFMTKTAAENPLGPHIPI